jgi:hypothetical protein
MLCLWANNNGNNVRQAIADHDAAGIPRLA